ncbi:MAG: hypothetical protein GXO46_13895 [Chlorobi bacterium]|uniref:hypothetical protein n=1 Tax=Sphingobacterium multivorum TaxID=28454 RepID=UPI002450C5D0|nr:hypothetical protein [Sphingobacterium multivorum]NPA10071.1 hypothetical protein [Chlorobiota bacterium]
MKKFILTVTVLGFAGLSYASSPIVKKVTAEKRLAGCFTQTVTQYEDLQGNYVSSSVGPRVSVECAQGQLEGSTQTTYVHQISPLAVYWLGFP